MNPCLGDLFVVGLLFAVISYTCANSGNGPTVEGETRDSPEDYEETEDPFVTQLQDNYRHGFVQILDFFKSTNLALSKINEKIDLMEISRSERDTNVQAKVSQIEKILATLEINIANITTDLTSLKGRTTTVESDNVKIKTNVTNLATPESFLKMLPLPANGNSFRGSTFERIAAALPTHSMAVKFVNYMDTDLTGYQLYLKYGSTETNAPTTISSQTAQVATFKPDIFGDVQGTMMYRIGRTNSFLHVFVGVWENNEETFAVAFLSKGAPDWTIGWNGCRHPRRPTEPIEKYRCEANVPFDTAKSLLIHEGNVYVKATFTQKRTSTVIIEVFKFTL